MQKTETKPEWTVDTSKTFHDVGSVSHGTMREQDLIPCFIDVLAGFDEDWANEIQGEIPPNAFDDDDHWFWNTERASAILEDLFDALNEHAQSSRTCLTR